MANLIKKILIAGISEVTVSTEFENNSEVTTRNLSRLGKFCLGILSGIAMGYLITLL